MQWPDTPLDPRIRGQTVSYARPTRVAFAVLHVYDYMKILRRRKHFVARFGPDSQSKSGLACCALVAVRKPPAARVRMRGGLRESRAWRIGIRRWPALAVRVVRAAVSPLRRLRVLPLQGAQAVLRGQTGQSGAGLQVRVQLHVRCGPPSHAADRAPGRVPGRQVAGRSRAGLRTGRGDDPAARRPGRLPWRVPRGPGHCAGAPQHALPVLDLVNCRVPGYCALRVRAVSFRSV